ncbi:hypothetical protein [Actinomadura sp. 9N407]|uniref:hypothetical protein n=1 Tax=Actinomadura sp. 9N407 TaxID=3375154 RepID=UPI00378936A3
MDPEQTAAALRQISRGLAALADAISPPSGPAALSDEDRYRAIMNDWGRRGLTRPEAGELFRRHGFSPQAAGGWARGGWMEVRDDGLRHLTERSHQWLAEQEAPDEQHDWQRR